MGKTGKKKTLPQQAAEGLFPLREAAGLLRGRFGQPAAPSSLVRWASIGFRAIVLETVRLGSARFTTVEAVRQFKDAMTAKLREDDDGAGAPVSSSPGPDSPAPQQAGEAKGEPA